jgi:uncharacterized RDD family membrane protein YckC
MNCLRWAVKAALVILVVLLAASAGAQVAADGASHAALTPASVALGTGAASESHDWSAMVSRPVVRVGQDYTLRAGEVVRELRSVLGDVILEGHVERDVIVVLGSVQVKESAVVDGALVVIGGSATIASGARVGRDLGVIGGTLEAPAGFAPGGDFVAIGSPALGDGLRAFVPWLTRGLLWGRPIVPDLTWVWAVFGLLLVAYLVVNVLFDGPVGASTDAILERPFSVFLLGLLVLVLTVPMLAILAATVIGLAIVPFVLCAFAVAGLIGKAGVARAIGRSFLGDWLSGSRLGSLVAFALGAAVLCVAYILPILGLVTWAVTSVLAVGAAAVMLRRRLRSEQRLKRATAAPTTGAAEGEPQLSGRGETTDGMAAAPETGAGSSFADESFAETRPAVEPPTLGGTRHPEPAPIRTRAGLFPPATFLDRLVAFAIDCLLVGLAVQLLDLSRYDGSFPLLVLAYHVAFWAWKGTTLGGVVVGLRVTRSQGQDLRFADALIRGLTALFSIAALGIGCFWMLQDPARQMWHDKIAGTHVLKVPREVVLQED